MASQNILIDGSYISPERVNSPRSKYPFRINGDRVTEFFEQDYWQLRANFIPCDLGVAHPTRGGFYLGIESDPIDLSIGAGLCQFTRTWFRVPVTQSENSSKYITKPEISTSSAANLSALFDYTPAVGYIGLGNTYNFGSASFVKPYFYPIKYGTGSQASPSGGTMTFTYKASTTGAIAYNAVEGTIQTALNGLASSIADGVTWTVNVYDHTSSLVIIILNSKGIITPITANISSWTTTGPKVSFTKVFSGNDQRIYFGQTAVIPSHGLDATKDLIIGTTSGGPVFKLGGSTAATQTWSVVDTNTIAFVHFQAGFAADYTTFSQQGGSYSPGTTENRIKKITDFFWPGVTAGITTADDIPLAAYQGDAVSIINAVVAGTTSINLEVGELANWMGTPILARTRVATNAATL